MIVIAGNHEYYNSVMSEVGKERELERTLKRRLTGEEEGEAKWEKVGGKQFKL